MKKKIEWFINNSEECFCVIFMTTMVISLFLQVIFRYIVGKSLPWSEEISRYGFVFLVYFAAVLVTKYQGHIRVTAQFKPFKPIVGKIFILISDLIWLAFNGIVTYQAILVYIGMGVNKQISPVLGWNLKYVFLVIPVSFLFMTFRILQNYYKDYIKTKNEGGSLNAN